MFVALVILGISSVFYSHYISVRDAEAVILAREVVDCLTLNEIDIHSIEKNKLLSFCGYDNSETERFFVSVNFTDNSGNLVNTIYQGDSGALWVKELFEDTKKTETIKKYKPGYFTETYPFFDSVNNKKLNMTIKVLISNEF
jgi:hypothetical protein